MPLQHINITKKVAAIIGLCLPFVAVAQHNIKFSEAILINPIKHSSTFDTLFYTEEVPSFEATHEGNTILMENGYALHKLQSTELLASALEQGAEPVAITIIFTKYPLHQKDWITNYYTLLSNRIQALLSIDSTLNRNDIIWKLTLQTKAQNGNEAKLMFHGIEVKYKEKPVAANNKPHSADSTKVNAPQSAPPVTSKDDTTEHLSPDPQFFQPQPSKTVKQRKRKEPKCPDITTRLKKPKRPLLSRLFRRR
ncbi:MAG: hypothetical protein JW783_09660 [Bacteroidales bacterium]|nr:hypothetical protein [Bacteroidales bacterium]MBN2750804.1 hypothetical protein [Bacteroidales bacterium]